ncbi:Phenylacetaldoxime dehydratase-like protein [Cladobotryum mycophilum]|uniref:Phenylacetaldoxime dehydratase-like protein n=1 Tax=Cladobotryum mycophilum TaxID=491253 RepID=A0ABR0SPV7_9HYPO
MLQSAIPEHLRVERTLPAATPPGYVPSFQAYSANFGKDVANLTMAIVGAQFETRNEELERSAMSKVTSFLEALIQGEDTRPAFSEWASVTDREGFYNVTSIAYWKSDVAYQKWSVDSGFKAWWQSLESQEQKHGWFLEIFSPTVDRFETVFSDSQVPEGAAHMRDGVLGPIQEHVYWGSMRDRMPASQTNPLDGEKANMRPRADSSTLRLSQRVRVSGKKNLAIIRSGQDWHSTVPEERALYLSTMHPVLTKGMDFLRDQGDEVGCYSCRFMDIIDSKTSKADKDRTFALAYFDDLSSLERWSKEHPTHLAIFGGFLQYATKLKNNLSLRLFHEVLVVTAEQQLFEYVGCHPGTGMLVTVQ